MLLSTCVLASFAAAAPAAASSLTVTEEPGRAGANPDVVTATYQADTPGYVRVYAIDKVTPCPASEQEMRSNPPYPESLDDAAVVQGSSTVKFRANVGPKSHLCGYLVDNSGATTAVSDTPVRSYVDVAGWNFLTFVSFELRGGNPEKGNAEILTMCGAGESGVSDEDCPLAGHLTLTVSDATRKKFHLKGRTVLKHDFSEFIPANGLAEGESGVKPKFKLYKDPYDLRKYIFTLKVTVTSPRRASYSYTGKFRNGGGIYGIRIGTWTPGHHEEG
jgi:hypothetical protein